MRQAACPWDPWVQDFEPLGAHGGWFTVTEKALSNGHIKIEYSPQEALKTKAAEAITVLGNQKTEFDRLPNIFADKSTEDAEIITHSSPPGMISLSTARHQPMTRSSGKFAKTGASRKGDSLQFSYSDGSVGCVAMT
jgi:hypothetical protein